MAGRSRSQLPRRPCARHQRPRDFAQRAKMIVAIATGEIEDREPTPEEQGKDPAAVSLGPLPPIFKLTHYPPSRRLDLHPIAGWPRAASRRLALRNNALQPVPCSISSWSFATIFEGLDQGYSTCRAWEVGAPGRTPIRSPTCSWPFSAALRATPLLAVIAGRRRCPNVERIAPIDPSGFFPIDGSTVSHHAIITLAIAMRPSTQSLRLHRQPVRPCPQALARDRSRLWPAPPRRCAPSCWRGPPPPPWPVAAPMVGSARDACRDACARPTGRPTAVAPTTSSRRK